MNRNTVSLGDKARNLRNKAAGVGTAILGAAGAASAQVSTTEIIGEIDAAQTAGMAVLGAMILAGLAFKAWKLLKRA